uniref:Uncharacterized protein n=1 Tax=Panagrolaimus sp. PS1159 TaxID=55785 RepID=A0AC35F107_9BILA
MALLKSRASTVLKSETISYSDRVFYKQCSKNAQTPAALAKCVVNLLDLNESTSFGNQKDSPSTIERITELIFGKQYLNLPSFVYSQPPQKQQREELKRIIPVNENFEAEKFYKTTMTPKPAYPFAAKEFYSYNTIEDNGFYEGLKSGLKPYPVKIRRLENVAKNEYYPGKNLIKRRLKRQLGKKRM